MFEINVIEYTLYLPLHVQSIISNPTVTYQTSFHIFRQNLFTSPNITTDRDKATVGEISLYFYLLQYISTVADLCKYKFSLEL